MAIYKQSDIELAVDTLREYSVRIHRSVFYEEWAYLYRFVRNHKPSVILEIGSFYHVSSLAFLTGLSHNGGGELISVDLEFPSDIEFNDLDVKWTKIKGSSFDVMQKMTGLDLILVDGAHGADAVEIDTRNSLNAINNDGYIIWHDSNYKPTISGIKRVINIDDCFSWSSQPDRFHGILVYPNPHARRK